MSVATTTAPRPPSRLLMLAVRVRRANMFLVLLFRPRGLLGERIEKFE